MQGDTVSMPPTDAGSVYRHRSETLRAEERRLEREHRQLGYVRLAFGIAIALLLFPPRLLTLLPLLGFGLAARSHARVLARLAEVRRTLSFLEHGLARLEDRWAGLRPRAVPEDAKSSLFAMDLDLFGPAGVFELLCEARSSLGETVLASWLLRAAPVAEARSRQAAVRELRERLPLREAFAAAPGQDRVQVDVQALKSWASGAGQRVPEALRWIAPVLCLLTLAAAWRFATTQRSLLLVLCLLVDVSLTFQYRHAFRSVFTQAETAGRSLRTVHHLLASVERESFVSPVLTELQGALRIHGRTASSAMRQLAQQVTWAEARSNYVVKLLDAPFLYSLQWALALQRWRDRFGPSLTRWLEVLGEGEALLSLAGYSFEHPMDAFSEFQEGPALFEASALGHVLLPEQHCIRNDVRLGDGTQLLLVSGSNMSGKSTLLRSVGVNAVLAFAGAPVRARSLVLSPLTVAASIQVNDSLQAGRSKFYAEILRLRAIVDAARVHGPVLFLVDEVLAGTNSSDRSAGAQGLIRELLTHRAIGLLSTHDLALTEVAPHLRDAIRNVHFQDELADGQLQFSYTLQEGVVQRSNGLALMRMIGLDV